LKQKNVQVQNATIQHLILKISDITVNLVLISGVKNVQFVIGFTKKKIQKLMKDLSVGARNAKIKLIRRNLNWEKLWQLRNSLLYTKFWLEFRVQILILTLN